MNRERDCFRRQHSAMAYGGAKDLTSAKLYTVLQHVTAFVNDDDANQRLPIQSPAHERYETTKEDNRVCLLIGTSHRQQLRGTN